MWGDVPSFWAEDSHKADAREAAGASARLLGAGGVSEEEGGCREGLGSRLFLTSSAQLRPDASRTLAFSPGHGTRSATPWAVLGLDTALRAGSGR